MEDYFVKTEQLSTDLSWNLPELKQGMINVVGGNAQRFNTEIKISEFILENYPIKEVHTILPDSLKEKLPPLPNLVFLKSTDTGSFADTNDLADTLDSADYNLLLGDFSKNSITITAVATAISEASRPLILTRDTLDLIADATPDQILMHDNVIYLASLPQLQKLLRSVYYPKMLLLSQPLLQIADVLHKFTLSYPAKIITLASDQILLAENGFVRAIPLAKSGLSPLTFWGGELAAKITVLNLFSPGHFLDATMTAIFC
ncbi:hypothetical protein IKE87_02595 [Candidatus Saccharibacteria bacterium]|nr:hypothetical protein [Candidatus Saccharibacteria bacterium]